MASHTVSGLRQEWTPNRTSNGGSTAQAPLPCDGSFPRIPAKSPASRERRRLQYSPDDHPSRESRLRGSRIELRRPHKASHRVSSTDVRTKGCSRRNSEKTDRFGG